MRNSYYEIDGAIGKFIRYRFVGGKACIIEFSTRSYERDNEEMPAFLATLRPINDGEKVSYDHIAAERLLQDNIQNTQLVEAEELPNEPAPGKGIASYEPTEDTLEAHLKAKFASVIDMRLEDAMFVNKKLNETLMRLKGDKGKEFATQADKIIDAVKAKNEMWGNVNNYFKTGIVLQKAHNEQKHKDKDQQDHKKD
jgi:hypothetical protein